MTRLLPFAAGLFVPTAIFAAVYLLQGENPIWGLVAGAIGLIGALSAELARLPLEHRQAELEEQQRWVAAQRERKEEGQHFGHEGLRRLQEDVARDEAIRKSRPPETQ